jgi:hypothetical protein
MEWYMCIFNDEESKRIEIIMEKLTGPVTESKKEKNMKNKRTNQRREKKRKFCLKNMGYK